MPAVYVVQHGNNLVANVGKPGLVLQQQGMHVGNQAWLQNQASGMFSGAGPTTAGQVAMYQQQPQQLRMTQVPVSTPPLAQQQQQVLLGGPQMAAPRQAGPQVLAAAAAADAHKQVVYVNINGALQRGIVHNGAVYLLANDSAGPGAQTAGHMHQATAGQVLALQQQSQQQQQFMVQQVLPTGQLVPMSGALLATSAGAQLPTAQQLQPQAQRPIAGSVPPVSMGLTSQVQQQPVVVMNAGMGPNMSVTRAPVSAAGLTPAAVSVHARPQQQQQLLLPVAQTGARGPVAGPTAVRPASNSQFPGLTSATLRPTVIAGSHTVSANSVSANTASLMPRMAASTAAAAQQGMRPAPAMSQPMTIAAALAALPSHSSAAGPAAPAASSDLSSPVAPPGTPGMANGVAARSNAAGTIGAVIGKLANPSAIAGGQAAGVGSTVLGALPASSTPAGSSPMTSQPGTPSRSNSVGANRSSSGASSSSSSFQLPVPDAASSTRDAEGKMAVMRMFARTFVETGIGLEQALNMIQPADRDLLAAAFAAEAAAACGASQLSKATDGVTGSATSSSSASGKTATQSGLADLGGEQISMPLSEGRASGLEQLANLSGGASFDGTQDTAPGLDTFSLGSWGFSLFSNVASDLGSDRGASSFGGTGGLSGKVAAASMVAANGAAPGDDSTATLFANLNL